MSREHKYKALDKRDNKVKEVTSIDFLKKEVVLNYYDLESNEKYTECAWVRKFSDVILLEYVGFRDNKGIEIYEGYIDRYGYVVTYLADLNGGLGMNAGWYLQRDNFESWSELECNNDIEIIGNIFEHPEKAINNCNTDYTILF